jgi:hypothetical protein
MDFGNLSYSAGYAATWASVSEKLYDNDIITYENHLKDIKDANAIIRKYNRFLREHFNESVTDLTAIAEYPLVL